MKPIANIKTSLPQNTPRTDPEIDSGAVSGNTPAARIAELYRVLQHGAEVYGGAVALAAEMRKRVPDVSQRLRRAQDANGDVQRASLDMMAHVATDPEARWEMLRKLTLEAWGTNPPTLEAQFKLLTDLCAAWGAEPPQRRRSFTREDVADAALEVMNESGGMRDSFREAIAKKLGVDPDQVIW